MGNCFSEDKPQAAYAAPQSPVICEVIFFPDAALPCHYGKSCRRNSCNFAHQPTSLSRLLDHLASAHKEIKVCVFTITCNEIAEALLQAHRRGVQVRIISDDDQMSTTGSDVARLKEAGIPVKIDNSRTHMHNKFAIIDGHLLLNGSFNWTRQAVLGNNENVVIQNNPLLVKSFSDYFERLWRQFTFF